MQHDMQQCSEVYSTLSLDDRPATFAPSHQWTHSNNIHNSHVHSFAPTKHSHIAAQHGSHGLEHFSDTPHAHNITQSTFPLSPTLISPSQQEHSWHLNGSKGGSSLQQTVSLVYDQYADPSYSPHDIDTTNLRSSQMADSFSPRLTLSGSLDPTTGIFYKSPEHPRLRTAKACVNCRTRKAKCSGDTPCQRCLSRGLACAYTEGDRLRGPNKPKSKDGKPPSIASEAGSPVSSRGSTVSHPRQHSLSSAEIKPSIVHTPRSHNFKSPSAPDYSPEPRLGDYGSFLSLGEHRSGRPRPPPLILEGTSNMYQHGYNVQLPMQLVSSEEDRITPDGHSRIQEPFPGFPQRSQSFSNGSMTNPQVAQSSYGMALPVAHHNDQVTSRGMTDFFPTTATTNHAVSGYPTANAMFTHRPHSRSDGTGSDPHSAASMSFKSSPTSPPASPVTPPNANFTHFHSRETSMPYQHEYVATPTDERGWAELARRNYDAGHSARMEATGTKMESSPDEWNAYALRQHGPGRYL